MKGPFQTTSQQGPAVIQLGDPVQGWFKRSSPLLFLHKKSLIFVVFAAIVTLVAQASTPVVVRGAVDKALVGHGAVGYWLAVIVALAVIRFMFGYLLRYQAGQISLNLEFDLRTMLFEHLQSLDLATHDSIQTGQLTSRANADVRVLQMFLMWTPVLITSLLMTVLAFVIMMSWNVKLAILATLPLPLVLVIALRMKEKLFPASWVSQQKAADMAEVVDENVTGVRVVRAFGQEKRELNRYASKAREYFAAQMRTTRYAARYSPPLGLIPYLGLVLVLLYGGRLVQSGELTIGQFLAYNTYVLMMIGPIQMLGMFIAFAQRARASAERILEVFDSKPTIFDTTGAKPLKVRDGRVEFRNVKFGYIPSEPVLKGLSLNIAPGERVAVVGGNRSGKSTITTLLPRFYDPQDGVILIDGQDISEASLDSLRRQVGIVFEDSFLFSGTIKENISYGKVNATDDEIERAARAAGAHEFIVALADGYETQVGESGLSVSGGQRQRISLARALLGDPKILVLDDATSSVDVKTEREILDALAHLLQGRTTILVASRPSTVSLADRVVVLDGGIVSDSGSHQELMDRSPLYRELMGEVEAIPGMSVKSSLVMGAIVSPSAEGSQEGARPKVSDREIDAMAGRGKGGRGMMMQMPATPDLLKRVEALPPANDEPDIDEESATQQSNGFHLREMIGPFAWGIALGLVLIIIRTGLGLSGPKLTQWGIDGTLRPTTAAIAFLGAIILQGLIMYFAIIWTFRIGERALYWLRLKVFSHLQRLSIDFYDREMSGRIMTRMTSDIDSFGTLIQEGVFNILIAALTLTGAALVLMFTQWKLALVIVLGVIPALLCFTWWFRKASDRAYLAVRDRIAAVLASLQEGIAGIRVSQAFVKEREEAIEFRQLSKELMDARQDGVRSTSMFFPGVDAIGVLAQAAVIGAAASLLARGQVTAAVVVAFILYLNQFFQPIQQLSQLFDTYQQAKAAGVKLNDLLIKDSSTPSAAVPQSPTDVQGSLEFQNVHFGYNERSEVLHGINLRINPGERVALVGKTGAGKSTLLKIAARFYDPSDGLVRLDGIDLKDLDPRALRRLVGVVPQEPFLFSGTIGENIAYGRPEATDLEVAAAAELVGAHDIFVSSSQGYNTPILGRGKGLSAGEKQLIALARVALSDPRFLLLDEPTSRLDLQTEGHILSALNQLLQGRTGLIIAHRLSTVRSSDRIAVMHDGAIVEVGSHDALIQQDGVYADLYDRWLGVTPSGVSAGNTMPVDAELDL